MRLLKADFKEICRSERGIVAQMSLNFLLSAVLLVFAFVHINPNIGTVKVGYSDLVGYRDGTWDNLLAFPILAIVFGIFHSILALRLYHKRGSGMTKFFLVVTSFLILGTFLVLLRLTEGI